MPVVNPRNEIQTIGLGFRTRTGPLDQLWNDVVWSPNRGLFVAVSADGAARVITSPDGIVWTTRVVPLMTWRSVAWSQELGLFVAVASAGAQRVMTSPDGIVWTIRNAADNARTWFCVAWSPQLALFVATSTDAVASVQTSPDGINWTLRATPNALSYAAIAWSAGLNKFVAVSNSAINNPAIWSSDGIEWFSMALPPGRSWRSICWSPDARRFVIMVGAGAGAGAAWSVDGLEWNDATTPPRIGVWAAVEWCYDYNCFVAVSQDGATTADQCTFSRDGKTWISGTMSALNVWTGLAYSTQLCTLVAVSQSGLAGARVATACPNFQFD